MKNKTIKDKQTVAFIGLLEYLAIVFLQDMAVFSTMEDWNTHPLFLEPLFRSDEFLKFRHALLAAIDAMKTRPRLHSIEAVAPALAQGIQSLCDVTHAGQEAIKREIAGNSATLAMLQSLVLNQERRWSAFEACLQPLCALVNGGAIPSPNNVFGTPVHAPLQPETPATPGDVPIPSRNRFLGIFHSRRFTTCIITRTTQLMQ